MGNDHGRPKDIAGEVRQAFTSTADTAFDVCLENQLVGRSKLPSTNPNSCAIRWPASQYISIEIIA